MSNTKHLYHYDMIDVKYEGKEGKAYDVNLWDLGNIDKSQENVIILKVTFAYKGQYYNKQIEYLNYSLIHGIVREFILDRSQFMCMFTQSFEKLMKEDDKDDKTTNSGNNPS